MKVSNYIAILEKQKQTHKIPTPNIMARAQNSISVGVIVHLNYVSVLDHTFLLMHIQTVP